MENRLKLYQIPFDNEGYSKSFSLEDLDKEFDETENNNFDINPYAFFERFGFLVVRGCISEEDADKTQNEIFDIIESKISTFKRDDISTWDNAFEEGTSIPQYGSPSKPPVFKRQFLLNRTNPNVFKVFSKLLKNEELVVNHDRCCFFRPGKVNEKWKTRNNVHLDMNPYKWMQDSNEESKKELDSLRYERIGEFIVENNQVNYKEGLSLQGVINLRDNKIEDGGYCVTPGFHHEFREYFGTTKPQLTNPSWNFQSKDIAFKCAKRISMRKGDMVVWNQQMPHGSMANNSDNHRMAQFLKIFPQSNISPKRYKARKEAMERILKEEHNNNFPLDNLKIQLLEMEKMVRERAEKERLEKERLEKERLEQKQKDNVCNICVLETTNNNSNSRNNNQIGNNSNNSSNIINDSNNTRTNITQNTQITEEDIVTHPESDRPHKKQRTLNKNMSYENSNEPNDDKNNNNNNNNIDSNSKSLTNNKHNHKEPYFNRTELVRLLIQSLDSLGYDKSSKILEQESGISLQSKEINQFSESVIEGDWKKVEELLPFLKLNDRDTNNVKFLIFSQKFLEYLEHNKISKALQCLREEITPLNKDSKKLQHLTSLIMTVNTSETKKIIKQKSSRVTLLSEIRKFVNPNLMLPDNRLEQLIKQSIQYQIGKCLYHNTSEQFTELFKDHTCEKDQMPLDVLFTLKDKHRDEVWFITFSNDGKKLASCSRDNNIIIWDMSPIYLDEPSEPKVLHTLSGHTKEVSHLAWSPNDKYLLSTSNDSTTKLWNPADGTLLKTFAKHTDYVTCCSWHPDNKRFVTGGNDRNIYLWSIENLNLDQPNGNSSSSSSNLSNNNYNNHLHIPNQSAQPIKSWQCARVNDLAIHKDGRQLIVICHEKKIRIYDLENEKKAETSLNEADSITSMQLSKDCKYALVNTSCQEIHLWDLEKQNIVQKYRGQKQGRFVIRSCFGGVDEAFILSGSEDSTIYIWHRQTGTLLETLSRHSGTVNTVCWSPCSPNIFCSASDDQTIKVWSNTNRVNK
ncbi:hypothetical protein DICPUDRAFT_46602 [Dictyostelium purpureum]|uniref:CTLH domain-containing protein n=1 Tax=Dictyostelium purpureum TaxID=5786 RepID=F0ZFG2_DICPU|nr:uncharacterized protein DICPUDRAFT_46602 [Dictyostelium purpureum]EGC37333.1 hypothetical protein DICPUDRAFT_46602 [Dictyostelium purpureum]|eukprot:XP_003286147.1 hypothetical protein DICPUDRAFT_46602 [Dictyostelium purpureum]